jgi:predicted AlkP superfamily pyrophosphatase or phosphodiesterase
MKRSFVFALVIFLAHIPSTIFAQTPSRIPSEKPKLIVCLVVDQMRYDFIHRYWDKFGEDGIKRLVMSGTFCKNAAYDYLINETAVGHATIATGALPSHHGIISNNWYDNLQEEIVYCVADDKTRTVGGKYESGQFSPRQMLASTIGDEIRLASNFKSKVIGLALDNPAAILSAGHAANYAFWYDNLTGSWISSDYYMDSLPGWVKQFNEKKLADSYLDRTWETLLPLEAYEESGSDSSEFESGLGGRHVFPYELEKISQPRRNERDYRVLKYTPFGNVFTRDFATALVANEELGKDEYTDYLAIGFSAQEYIGKNFGSNSVEMEDAILRLDVELAHFINFVDNEVGEHNTLFILTADHGLAYQPDYLTRHKIPSGDFFSSSSLSLLESYLSAIYGRGDWVKYYYGQQIYLNRELIETSGITYQEIQDRTAQFLIQFAGVSNAVTSYTLQTSSFSDGIFHKMQNGYHQKRSGDVIINLSPGWLETDGGDSYHSSYLGDNHVPLIFSGWKIKRASLTRPVKMIDIAPTLSYFLEIARPNVSTGNIILELMQ